MRQARAFDLDKHRLCPYRDYPGPSDQKVGDDLNRKTGLWMKIKIIIDRDNDAYQETVSDPRTGQIIHHTDEPLSEHQGHGSARSKK